MTEHLGAPWTIEQDDDRGVIVVDSQHEIIWLKHFSDANERVRMRARAHAVVRAINSHEAMLEALKELRAALDEATDSLNLELAMCSNRISNANDAADAAIAKATEKGPAL